MQTLFVGDLSLDLSLSASHVPAPDEKVHCGAMAEAMGGVVTNTAVAFAKSGGAAKLLAQVGTDAASAVVTDELRAEGLGRDLAVRAGRLCRVVTILEPHGEKRLLLYPGISLYPDASAIDALELADVTHVHTACFGSAWRRLIGRCREAGMNWSLDLEPASFEPGLEVLADAIDGATVIFCNTRAADRIGPDPVTTLLTMGARSVVCTNGAEGATLHRIDTEPVYSAPPPDIVIRDTTGAGDCLAGWYLAGLAERLAPADALSNAVRAASLSCATVGAQTGFPARADIFDQTKEVS